jgi:protein-tyrosine phosphatase
MVHHSQVQGLAWTVDSAGTSDYHVGGSPDSRSVAVARSRGLDISHQRARQFMVSDFTDFDHIVVMDASNFNDVKALATSDEDVSKISMLLNYSHPGENRAVPDPYYVGSFDDVYDMIEVAVIAFIEKYK